MKTHVLVVMLFIPLFTIPVFAQQMGFYHNERYDFSFEVPMDWRYQEGVSPDRVTTFEVVMYPEKFSLKNVGDDANLMDMQTASMGLSFQIESPLIAVNFENLLKSEVSSLSEKNLKEYFLNKIKTIQPSTKIIDSYSKTHSWGWEVYALYTFDMNLGFGSGIPYVGEEVTFYFKDRESYNVSYGAPDAYFDTYRPIFDHALNTMIIKSVEVPEFQEIALLVLGSSIVFVIAFARKFRLMKLNNQ